MDFALNDEQEMLKKSASDFLKSECPKSVVRQLEESDSGYSGQLWKKMAKLGWMGILIPEEYGGVGRTLIEEAVLFEEFGRAAMPGPMFATLMGTLVVLEEPDAGLHPSRIHLLAELVERIAKDRGLQVLATTHSPTLLAHLSDEALGNVVAFGRRPETGLTVCSRLKDLPYFDDLRRSDHLERLISTGWVERAL